MPMPLVDSPKPITTTIKSDRGDAEVEITAEICPDRKIEYSCIWKKVPLDVEVVFHGQIELLVDNKRVTKSAKFYAKSTNTKYVIANTGVPGETSQYIQARHLETAKDGRFTNLRWSSRQLGVG